MGDNGNMYEPKELLHIYRDKLIPLADVITPNQFKVELVYESWEQQQQHIKIWIAVAI